ncbi:putative CRISPR-associated protein [Bacteroidetes/Chlorobi group bacterium Naka2016]|nr:MAG: putative CRISPR-associated protein [Bacteroidetes/Chlorobi group bacterium Naka2016]
MKEFHIINVGVSIITNFQKSDLSPEETKNVKLSDNELWRFFLDNSNMMNKLYDFVNSDPRRHSAELNALLRKIENSQNEIEVYFTGTKTPVNEICVRTLERFMKERGITVYTTKEFPGYFLVSFDGEDKVSFFVNGISDMLDHLIRLATKKKEEGYRVYFNPTGGFKAHVIASALAGFMTNCEVYYLNEEFNDIITFPPLFYLPKGKEVDLLKILKDKEIRNEKAYEKLEEEFSEEIDRLEIYGLLEREQDESGRFYRIMITNRGILYLKFKKEA